MLALAARELIKIIGVIAGREAGLPVIATVDQADLRGLATTRPLFVAEAASL